MEVEKTWVTNSSNLDSRNRTHIINVQQIISNVIKFSDYKIFNISFMADPSLLINTSSALVG